MSLDPIITKKVLGLIQSRRNERQSGLETRRVSVFSQASRLKEIDAQMKSSAAVIIKAAFTKGSDPEGVVEELRQRSISLNAERAAILNSLGLPGDYLEDRPYCIKCDDTGYIGANPCTCFMELYINEQNAELSSFLDINQMNFDNFNFNYYSSAENPELSISPRDNIERIYDYCADYARSFFPGSENIFLNGEPGLGKTFLSACIAGEVSRRGFFVMYENAVNMFAAFEAERFSHNEDAAAVIRRYMTCDLFIIDDIGAEFISPLSQTSFYTVVNNRLISRKSTIINSNLTMDELNRRYSRQVMSRIEGEYRVLYLFGQDIRRMKSQVN